MRSKDITISANLIGLYIAITVLAATTPLNVSTIMYSALFGLFWNYLSVKRNLAIQAGRVAYNLCTAVYDIPKLVGYMKVQSIAGLGRFDWFSMNGTYPVDDRSIALLETLAKASPTLTLWLIYFFYACIMSLILPYSFYRYFRWKGIFKRLPSF